MDWRIFIFTQFQLIFLSLAAKTSNSSVNSGRLEFTTITSMRESHSFQSSNGRNFARLRDAAEATTEHGGINVPPEQPILTTPKNNCKNRLWLF